MEVTECAPKMAGGSSSLEATTSPLPIPPLPTTQEPPSSLLPTPPAHFSGTSEDQSAVQSEDKSPGVISKASIRDGPRASPLPSPSLPAASAPIPADLALAAPIPADLAVYIDEREALREGVAGMQEAFGQVQQMVQVWGMEGSSAVNGARVRR